MAQFMTFINKMLGTKGDINKVKFRVDNRLFEAYVPDDELWGAVKDILLNREYEFLPEFELNNFRNAIIVDAGAHVGLFSLVASCFAKRVIAIEAHPINYRLLEINVIKNHCQNVVTLNKALVGKDTPKIRIYNASHTGGYSTISKTLDTVFYEVSTITLREIIEEYGQIDLLKIDIEGAEFDVFKNIDNCSLRCIKAIVGEIHLEHGDMNEITRKLRSHGFNVQYFYPPVIKKSCKVPIRLYGNNKLKIIRRIVYTLSSFTRTKDKHLPILFAIR